MAGDNRRTSDVGLEQRLLVCIQGRMPFSAMPTMDSDLFDELGFDSGLLLDLIVTLESELGVQFREEDLTIDSLRRPRSILTLVQACLDRAGSDSHGGSA